MVILNVLGLLNGFLIIFSGYSGEGGVIIKFADFVKILTFFNIVIQFLKKVNLTLVINDARAVNVKNDLIREFLINFKAESVDELFVNFIAAKT